MSKELHLGGLILTTSYGGDVDIRTPDGKDMLRIQRADLEDVIRFFNQARRDATR